MQGWTLVFDLDGTLVDTAPDLVAATNYVMKQLRLEDVSETSIRPYVGHGALAMIERASAEQGRVLSAVELRDLFGVFIAHYTANIAANSKPYPGVLDALNLCRQRGATLAVCTNKMESHARSLLSALHMTYYFKAITGRDSLLVCKPDPGHLTGTVALALGRSEKAIMIGDSETDILTAKAAGIPVIAVNFGYSLEHVATFAPNAVIGHYRDLVSVAEKLMSRT